MALAAPPPLLPPPPHHHPRHLHQRQRRHRRHHPLGWWQRLQVTHLCQAWRVSIQGEHVLLMNQSMVTKDQHKP